MVFRKFFPVGRRDKAEEQEENLSRYRRLWRFSVLITATVSLAPLIILAVTSFFQYQKAFKAELLEPINRLTGVAKHSLEFFLEMRVDALKLLVSEKTFDELVDSEMLARTFRNTKRAFGGFVDLGIIDSSGRQISYVGPYNLQGAQYQDQDWFHEVTLREFYLSDVFMGKRRFPHFIMAIKHERSNGDFYVLRATIDSEMLNDKVRSLNFRPSSDAFVINTSGILQTPSKTYGKVLSRCPLTVPPFSESGEVIEITDDNGHQYVLGYAYIANSPFIFMVLKDPARLASNWLSSTRQMAVFTAISIVLILILTMGTSSYFVSRIREADQKREAMLHQAEYTAKMASIGRLAAGVAHEINNPLAIINEKAGLAKDLIAITEQFPNKERFLKLIDSISYSVDRCRSITHRLLGFAKHMDMREETIDLEVLIKQVLGFLEKEAEHRNVQINIDVPPDFPSIVSDRGQLQQVFLNIVNNAFAAVPDNGRIDIRMERRPEDRVAVIISDNGTGIPEHLMSKIFEPFFTTKNGYGTGLGLSITYGIVKKLGGDIAVQSKEGEGATFVVLLPSG